MPAKRIFLKGIDYFQLLIDHHSKKKGGRGHEARLAIFLKGQADENFIRKTIAENEICKQLKQTRISKTFGLGYPSLYFTKHPSEIPVSFHHVEGNEIPESFLNVPVEVFEKPPLHLQVLLFNDGSSCMLFTFHHILFDFAGVQSLINSLAGKKDISLLPVSSTEKPFAKRFMLFFKAVFFTFREANYKMTVLERSLPKQKPFNTTFKELSFSKQETEAIFNNAAKQGLQLNNSIYFLAAVSKSLHDHIFSKQQNHHFIWLPVPVNFRRKGQSDAVLFNGLSFLFYKLKPKELTDMPSIINSIRDQMKDQIRNDMPGAFVDFADGYRFMPMPLYYPMLKLPSWGKLSSFSFSVLGKTFNQLDNFMGLPIADIKNYPSNSTSPGITFLFYEFRGELKLMTSWVNGQFTHAEQETILESVRNLLLEKSLM